MWDVSLPLSAALWPDTTSGLVQLWRERGVEGRERRGMRKEVWRLCMARSEPTSQGKMAVL